MISVLSPAFLWAGAALALVPLALHFIARRPPERRPLPTARFLAEDARTELRIERRPRDVPLLLVRVAFALAAGAIFAGVVWTPDRQGAAHVVLLDAGAFTAGLDEATTEAVDAARSALARGAEAGEEGGILAYGLEGGPRWIDEGGLEGLDDLVPSARAATYEDGLRALRRHLVEETRAASARVTWVTVPRWSGWTEGFGLLRHALWPGRIEVVPVGGAAVEGAGEEAPEAPLAFVSSASPGSSLHLAMEALGWRMAEGTGAGEPDVVFGDAFGDALEVRAREGATVVVWGSGADAGGPLPWRASAGSAGSAASAASAASGSGSPEAGDPPRGALVLAHGVTLEADIASGGGEPAPGARVVAVFENGAPAAAARPLGEGCLVFASLPLESSSLTALHDYPRLVETLGTGCAEPAGPDGPLDDGALAVLEGDAEGESEGEAQVDVAALAIPDGRSLRGAIVVLALLLLAADVALSRGSRA